MTRILSSHYDLKEISAKGTSRNVEDNDSGSVSGPRRVRSVLIQHSQHRVYPIYSDSLFKVPVSSSEACRLGGLMARDRCQAPSHGN